MIEKEVLKTCFLEDVKAWCESFTEGNVVLSESGELLEVSSISEVISGANCYDNPQRTEKIYHMTSYDLESYLKSFIISFADLKQYGFSEDDYINFLDNWNNIESFIMYEDNERVCEDYYFNYNNKLIHNLQINEICNFLIDNPFSKPDEEIKKCFEHINFDEIKSKYISEKLDFELIEKSKETKKPKI